MQRNQFSDLSPRRRSIRDIPLPNKPVEKTENEKFSMERERIEIKNTESGNGDSGGKKWWVGILVVVFGGFWGASIFLHAATVNIIPEQAEYKGTLDIYAHTNASPTELQYDSLQFIESISKKVLATGEESVSVKASGKVIIYNNYSTLPQKLIANTRLEATGGKIYRIKEAVIVPGLKTVDGKKIPGSVEATVYADTGGEAHNATKTDFTIPGFKGSAQYEGFYARSTTDLTGGFVGKQKIVDPKLLASTTDSLKAEIAAKISQSTLNKIPSDFIYISGANTIDFTVKPIGSDGDQAVITVEGNVRVFVFKKEDIDEAVRKSIGSIVAKKVMIHDYSRLVIKNIVENADKKSLIATVSGEAIAYAVIEKDGLVRELAGVKKSLVSTIMSTHPEIVESQIYIRPPWMMSLPDNPERIHIIEKIDE